MKSTIKISIIFCFLIFILPTAFAALNVSLSDQGTDVITTSTGENLASGNLNVQVWDAASGGTLVYNETFANAISNGSWNVMLGENSSNSLPLEYGAVYYKDYQIAGEDADFTNFTGAAVERQYFYSPLGSIGPEDITAGDFSFDTATLYIDATNNRVGVNVNLPGAALDVMGNIKVGSGSVEALNYTGSIIAGGAMYFVNSTGATMMEIAANGNIGIGTTAAPDGEDRVTISGGPLGVLDQVKALNYSGTAPGGAMYFANSTGQTLMTITAAGQVGIGKDPGMALDVSGGILASGEITTEESSVGVGAVAISMINDNNLTFQNSSSDAMMTLTNNGRLGIGTTGPSNALSVAGAIDAASTVYAFDFSGTGAGNFDISFLNSTGNVVMRVTDSGEMNVSGIQGDGTGQIVCIKADGALGTCTDDPAGDDGDCTCA